MMTRQIMIGPLLIRPARTHGSPVRTGRTHGLDREKALHNKLFRASGPDVRVTGAHWPFHQKSRTGARAVRPGRAPGQCAPSLTVV